MFGILGDGDSEPLSSFYPTPHLSPTSRSSARSATPFRRGHGPSNYTSGGGGDDVDVFERLWCRCRNIYRRWRLW